MASPAGASKSRASRPGRPAAPNPAALVPVRIPLPQPWTPSGRASRFPRSETANDPQIGVDLTPVSKVRRVFEGKAALLEDVFTQEELRYSFGRRRPFEHLAARYAAKEAVFKGLRTGLTGSLRWTDVEVVREACGGPRVILRGEAARLAVAKGFRRCALSLTHAGDYAFAAVLFIA